MPRGRIRNCRYCWQLSFCNIVKPYVTVGYLHFHPFLPRRDRFAPMRKITRLPWISPLRSLTLLNWLLLS